MSSLDGAETDYSRIANGSAAVQEIVNTLEYNPFAVVESFEGRVRREEGALEPGVTWKVTDNAERSIERVDGHVSLKKGVSILAHAYDLCRRYPQNPEYIRAFLAQGYKVSLDALIRHGSWELSWPLLGIPDPEEKESQLLSPTERVAVAALAKEKKVLLEVANSVRTQPRRPRPKAGDEEKPPKKE